MRRLLICLAALCCLGSATITRVTNWAAYPANSKAITPTAGDFLVVAYSYNASGALATCSDGTNTYVALDTAQNNSTNASLVVFYAANISGSSVTVTCTSESDGGVSITEYSGVATSSPIDTQATSGNPGSLDAGSSSTATWPQITVSSGDGVFAAATSEAGGTSFTGWTSPFSSVQINNSHIDAQGDDLNVSAGSLTATASVTGSPSFSGMVVAFKPSSGPPVGIVPRHHVK